ncbi:hypothetical protein FDC27_12775 [Clostridium botulinum]|nr:hypothetical protein [Clostridium botulinum]NFL59901.1 hypothetical protein [Clostridium botulinum]NFL63302.1 hypothetical protein [Clostridium botulinum]NFO67802.1 hypothetical protein [Clostridium botulinum]
MNKQQKEIRILPMDTKEFEERGVGVVQQEFFINDLPNRIQCEYHYKTSGLSTSDGSLVLFQYDNKIIASAIFKESVKYKHLSNEKYKGHLSFYKDTIKILQPISLKQIQELDSDVRKFSNVKWKVKGNFDDIVRFIDEIKIK